MFALNCPQELAADDGLEPLAPFASFTPARRAAGRHALEALMPAVGAVAGTLIAVSLLLAGALAEVLALVLGGTAALVYLGTAAVAARPGTAVLDLATATVAAGVALAAWGPAVSTLLVHAVWGILRGAWPGVAPGRSFTAGWAALHATAALLLGFGA